MIRASLTLVLLGALVYGLYLAYMVNYTGANPFQ